MTDKRIQATDRMVGASHPSLADTLNAMMLVEHNADGTHMYGVQGPQGPQGAQGFQGDQGTQGFQGPQGITGPQGAQGVDGAQGNQGDQGATGYQGPQGEQGSQGITGAQGNQGDQGANGYQGNDGAQGPQGVPGNQGNQGDQGTQGYQGSQGSQGYQGATGAGITWDGDYNGTTSYDQAKGVAFNGDLYVSLQDGNQGHQPDTSPTYWAEFTGTQGPQGATGATGAQGPQGNIGTQGVKGSQGTQGIQGAIGVQGPQGNVGAQGATGSQGTQGRQGATGVQGPQGNIGAQGVKGSQGNQGYQGSTGAQGPIGPQGNVGAQGARGVQGYQGSQGSVGNQGPTGVQGAAGPSLRDIVKGLIIYKFTTNVLRITWSGIILMNTSNVPVALTAATKYPDATVVGVNGRDKSAAMVAGGCYYLWVIYNATTSTSACLISTSNTAPTMPSGYTYKALVGACFWINAATGWKDSFYQYGSMGMNGCPDISYYITTTGTTTLTVSVPSGICKLYGLLRVCGNGPTTAAQLWDISGCNVHLYNSGLALYPGSPLKEIGTSFVLPVGPSPSSLSLYLNGTSATVSINGWEFY